MIVLLGVGFVAGVVTAVSPCVLPVLPVLLAGGASGRRPLRIVAGLVVSFAFFTLFAAWILDKLGLPDDLLRNLAIALLFVVAVTLLVPQAGQLIERPLAVFSRFRPSGVGGGFVFGAALGLVFVPCAGPVLATISVVAANDRVGWRAILLTVAYAVGAGIPMLAIAVGGRGAAGLLRRNAQTVRIGSGAVICLVALALVFHLDDRLTKLAPGYTTFLQTSGNVQRQLRKVNGEGAPIVAKKTQTSALPDLGPAHPIIAGGAWINSKPLTIQQLRGKVVLIDFWTYSCINCLRTLPHLESWYAAYHKDGLVIIGVHTPEFAFEHVTSNVEAAVKRLGIKYPVVQDNDYKTWDKYNNEYWPAEYLIDRRGIIRHTHFGEGEYGQTQDLIRKLLDAHGATAHAVPNVTPNEPITPETYLGYARLANYGGSDIRPGAPYRYRFAASLPLDGVSYSGVWTIGGQEIVAGAGARIRLHFQAEDVYLVAGGRGTVEELIDGKPTGTLHVDGSRLYTVRSSHTLTQALLELRFSPGVEAYSFTFG